MRARVKLPDCFDNLLRSELEMAIYESVLDREDTIIATRYIIEKTPQIEIAAELGYERSTISRRINKFLPRIINTIIKLNLH